MKEKGEEEEEVAAVESKGEKLGQFRDRGEKTGVK